MSDTQPDRADLAKEMTYTVECIDQIRFGWDMDDAAFLRVCATIGRMRPEQLLHVVEMGKTMTASEVGRWLTESLGAGDPSEPGPNR